MKLFNTILAPRFAKSVLIFTLTVSLVFLLYGAFNDSATFDESAHIPAGYANVKLFDYRLNPEHPPLLKALAALPLLFMNLNFPTHLSAWQKDVNGQWVMGGNFFYESGNDGQLIVSVSRLGPIFVTMLLAYFIYYWSKRLMGSTWALLPTIMFALSPHVLAHGHYVTTDIAATFGIVFALYRFIRMLFDPSPKNILYAALAFGLAQLMKFSAVLCVPFFIIIAIAWAFMKSGEEETKRIFSFGYLKSSLKKSLKPVGMTIAVFAAGYLLVVYPIYFIFTANYPKERQAMDTESILASYEGGRAPEGTRCSPMRCLADLTIKSANIRIFQPFAQYSLGVLTAFQRSQGGNANYFLGKVSGSGTPVYFPVIYLLKEPLPILIMIIGACLLVSRKLILDWRMFSLRQKISGLASSEPEFTAFAMLTFVAIYWASSITSPLNIGLRHLFPVLPFMYILSSWIFKKWVRGPSAPESSNAYETAIFKIGQLPNTIMKSIFVAGLMLWLFVETIFAAPYFLSYFNELGGGTKNGYKYSTDSNYDWGQDLLRLKEFTDKNPDIKKIAVDYFGGGSPKYFLKDKEENWWSSRGNPKNEGIEWLAVSVNTLQGSIQPTKGFYERSPENEYRWLQEYRSSEIGLGILPEPDYRAGKSIFIYKL